MDITNLQELSEALAALPEGSTANVLGKDLENGNFNQAQLPNGDTLDIAYSGPVADGYVSPLEIMIKLYGENDVLVKTLPDSEYGNLPPDIKSQFPAEGNFAMSHETHSQL